MIQRGAPACDIVLVGGSVVALDYKCRMSTEDVDICFRIASPELYNCCLILAKKYNLDEDWMNGAVMRSPSFSTRLFNKVRLYKSYNSILNVYLISDIDLFCMKLVAFRPKDKEDLFCIAKRLRR